MNIVEIKSRRNMGNVYVVNPGKQDERTVQISCFFGETGGRSYCIIYDEKMRILRKPSLFMTVEMTYDAENSRRQASSAIKLLYSFIEIIGIDFNRFQLTEARAFLQFVRGTLADGIGYVFELNTVRAETTVAAYLKTIKRYAIYLGIDDSPFLFESRIINKTYGGANKPTKMLSATPAIRFEAPCYITLDQYKSILSTINQDWSIEERCICRLMFEHGLRIGEVLGLTLEDLDESVGRDGLMSHAIILRNRKSDAIWQKAKTLISIKTEAQYRSSDYRKRNLGYSRVYISGSMFDDMVDYIEESRVAPGFLSDSCIADSVTGGENQYVFLNSLSRPLSSNLWNKRLRSIMFKAGVPVDKGSRKTNLNHRFRHGYAMFLTRQCHKDAYTVKTLLRHRSIASTEIYHKPTEEDVYELQGEVISELESRLLGVSDE